MKHIVTIGGGTGSYRVLSGIKNIPNTFISAIVSMADDGGNTGMLRKEQGIHAMGDIRQSVLGLISNEEIKKVMNHRFTQGPLTGYVVGNVFLSGAEDSTASFPKALEITLTMLQIKDKVIPVTLNNAELSVLLTTGQKIEGESKISSIDLKISDVEKIFYKNKVKLNPKAAQAIRKADYIIICPGDFYTSIVPNLIVEGFKEALVESKAKIIAVENLGNKETDNYLNKLEWYLGKSVDNLINGDKSLISQEIIAKEPTDTTKRSLIRHDSIKLAKAIAKIIR